MRRILITGSNRGIGLALVEQYLKQDDTLIFATCRNPESATALTQLANQHAQRVKVVPLDVGDSASIDEAARRVATEIDGLEMLINNAGILPGGVNDRSAESASFGSLEASAILHVLHINSVAPVIVAQAFADLLYKGSRARVVNVSSDAGSIELKQGGCNYSYPASKAALNMMTRCLAGSFRAEGVLVVSIHPGWIQTDMGGPNAALTLEQAVPEMVQVIDDLTLEDSGTFINWQGEIMPW